MVGIWTRGFVMHFCYNMHNHYANISRYWHSGYAYYTISWAASTFNHLSTLPVLYLFIHYIFYAIWKYLFLLLMGFEHMGLWCMFGYWHSGYASYKNVHHDTKSSNPVCNSENTSKECKSKCSVWRCSIDRGLKMNKRRCRPVEPFSIYWHSGYAYYNIILLYFFLSITRTVYTR